MKNFILSLLLILSSSASLKAQINVEPAEYSGVGADISGLEYDNDNRSKELVLLYNAGKDMFLNAGGYWGTRTTTFTVGLPLQLIKGADGKYNIKGPFDNKVSSGAGNMLGAVEKAGGGDRGVYFDRNASSGVKWTFELYSVEEKNGVKDYTYRIWVKTADNSAANLEADYMLVANNIMDIAVFNTGNDNLVRALTDEDVKSHGKEAYSLWKVVTTKQMVTDFETTYDRNNPSDATFLLRAQNFNRMNMFNSASSATDSLGWKKSGTFDYNYSKPNVDGYDNDNRYGMFYCGGITNGKKGGKLYQTVMIPKSGWYRIDCQGFFFNSKVTDKCMARLYAKLDGVSDNSVGSAYVDLLPKSYGEPYNGLELVQDDQNKSFIIADGIVSNKIEAGITFYNQLYPNHILIYVNFDEKKEQGKNLELGIALTDDMASNDFVYFDDFQLKYLGESFALDEGVADFHGMGDDDAEYKNRVMILKRTLAEDKWNSICLPVDLTKEQLNTAFFPNPMLAKLCDSNETGFIEFVTVPVGSMKNNDVALHKGECYLIRPGYGGRKDEGEIEIGDKNGTMIKAPYYAIDRVSLTKINVESELGISSTGRFVDNKDVNGNVRAQEFYTIPGEGYEDCKLRAYGTFQKLRKDATGDHRVPATSYTFVDGKLYHLPNAYSQKGFSCWIEDEHQVENPSAERHTLAFSTYINGISDNTTAIEGLVADEIDMEIGNAAVYNIQGQAVRRGTSSLEGLPAGVYVVSGKKVAIR